MDEEGKEVNLDGEKVRRRRRRETDVDVDSRNKHENSETVEELPSTVEAENGDSFHHVRRRVRVGLASFGRRGYRGGR